MSNRRSDPILDDLTEPQRRAVTYGEGPLLVVAGAGSGKTRVITRRIAYLVRRGVPPERIVGITFTNKAADEMRLRVQTMVGEAVTVRTFHSFCARMLRGEAHNLDMDAGFSIYDRTDSRRVVRQIRKDLNLDPDTYRPAGLLENISNWKDDIIPPSRAKTDAVSEAEEVAAEVYTIYEQRLHENNALDFDDLLVKTVELFSKCPGVLQRYQDRYLHVLVDEYQDTNLPQHLIAKGLQGKHRNITAVGDPDQMIYTWRGARIENIMEFEEDFPGAEVVLLEQNYRSSGNILRAASTSIRHNRLRHEKALWTERDSGEPVQVREFQSGKAEARWIARKMTEMVDQSVSPGEMAVLYRTKYQAFQLEKELVGGPVPYQVVDTVGFFDRKAVKDIRAYLRLIINPQDDEAFRRIVNVPSRGIGEKTVERLERAARGAGKSLCEAVRDENCTGSLPTRARRAVASFRDIYERLETLDRDSIRGFLKGIISETEYLESADEDERADVQEVLNHFLGFADQYDEDNEDGSLLDFMEQTALVSDIDGWEAGADVASLMTLHSAKGLEFDVVFISGLEETILPHQRAVEDNQSTNEHAMEEERRLFHVGMTRARHRLFVTHCRCRYMHGREMPLSPSPFLDELPEEGVDRVEAPSYGGAGMFGQQVRNARRKKGRSRGHTGSGSRGTGRIKRSSTKTKKKKKAGVAAGGAGSPLQIIGEDSQIVEGTRVQHSSYGEGTVVKVSSSGKYDQVRVDFSDKGVLTLLLNS